MTASTALLILMGLSAAADTTRVGPTLLKPAAVGVGRWVPDVPFTDIAGTPGKLSDYREAKALVIAFTSTTCPLCLKFAPNLAALEREYAARGIKFLFVNPVAPDRQADMKKMIEQHGLKGRYVQDIDGKLTAALAAATTTEAFVLDPARTVIYRGAVDDQYGLGYALEQPRTRYLATALNAFLENKAVEVAATAAPGCDLEPVVAAAPQTEVTYHNRIARLVQIHCAGCHRDGGVGPFPLEKYEDVVGHTGMIKKVLERGTMPPWFAAPEKDGHAMWSNDPSLAENDKKDLLAWLAGGKAVGDPADGPQPRAYSKDWQIGTPDAVLQISRPISVKATGVMPYQHSFIKTDFPEDKWVQAIEVQPTAKQVVHHVLVFANNPRGGGRQIGEGREEAAGFFACYVPGTSTLIYPEGFAKKLPAGARLIFQIHYTPNGTAVEDQTRIALKFAKEPPKREIHVGGVSTTRLSIPPGAEHHPVVATVPVPMNVRLLAFLPHMHVRGVACKYEAIAGDDKAELLLDVPHYDFNWQLIYRYAEPKPIAKGSTLRFTAWYDNSDKNPANPDPKKTVRWGPQTFDEMCLGYIEYYIEKNPDGSDDAPLPPPVNRTTRGILHRIDTDGDGKISRVEYDKFAKENSRFKKNPDLARRLFERLDANGDGVVDVDELGKLEEAIRDPQ